MKFFATLLFGTATLFADSFTLNNETPFRKIALQWTSSARGAQESNDALLQGDPLKSSELFVLRQAKTTLAIPKNAAYFRVLVWQTHQKQPDLLTNWVEIVPDKTYLLKEEHLTPILLMNGMGC